MVSRGEVTLDGLARAAACAYPSKLAFVDGKNRLTFQEFDRLVDRFAAALSKRGVSKGRRVAVLLFNQWEMSLTYFATLRLGAIIVPLNYRLVAAEMAYQIDDSGADTLVFASELGSVVAEVVRRCAVNICVSVDAEGPSEHHNAERLAPIPRAEKLSDVLYAVREVDSAVESHASNDQPSAIWYTSGTTGRPKGAVVTHASSLWAAASVALATGMNHDSRLLAVAPMFHRGPTDGMHIAAFMLGMTQIMLRTFTPGGLLDAIQRERATHAFIVPAMTSAVLHESDKGSYDLTSMRCWMSASAPLPVDLRARLESETTLPPRRIYDAYGITEALLIGTLPPTRAGHAPSVGQAVPMCHIIIRDPSREEVGPGQIGEITVSTPAMACDYVGNSHAWSEVTFVRGGLTWYATGDLGYVDGEGFIYIVDRSKDMIISGGENVYSAEVEHILAGMPGVAEVAVIGTPDERWGEAVTAVIVPAEDASLSESDVIAFCAAKLAGYKRPKLVQFADALPRNSFGKVRKDLLRRDAAARRVRATRS